MYRNDSPCKSLHKYLGQQNGGDSLTFCRPIEHVLGIFTLPQLFRIIRNNFIRFFCSIKIYTIFLLANNCKTRPGTVVTYQYKLIQYQYYSIYKSTTYFYIHPTTDNGPQLATKNMLFISQQNHY